MSTLKEIKEFCIPIEPVVRSLLSKQYLEWNMPDITATRSPFRTCHFCKQRIDSRKIKVFIRRFVSPTSMKRINQYICNPCLNKDGYKIKIKSEFKLYEWWNNENEN